MIRNCHKCGCEIERHKDQKVLEFSGENGQEFRVLCPTCNKMTLAFCTPAYIPEISKTEYELILYRFMKGKNEKSIFARFKDEVKHLRKNGFTVPEIAQGTGTTNRIIMEVLKC